MRHLQRPFWTDQQISEIYAGPHDWRVLGDGHKARIETTTDIARRIMIHPNVVADLSCGVGDVATSLGARRVILGDIAPGFPIQGPIEETIDQLVSRVDVFICAETLEHLQDPDMVLAKIRKVATALVCSVPISERPEDDGNGEHYWAFDRAGAEEMLVAASWAPTIYEQVTAWPGTPNPTYECGIWGCL